MNGVLSSSWTFVYKFLALPIWILFFGVAAVYLTLTPALFESETDYSIVIATLYFCLLAGAVFFYWTYCRIKKVELAGKALRISNFFRTIEVSLEDVESVSGSILMNPELIRIRFWHPTEFGEKITFIGTYRLWGGLSRHPVVQELKNLCESVKREEKCHVDT